MIADVSGGTPSKHGAAKVVELRHEAGLTAGATMRLRVGRYQFGPAVGSNGGLQAGTPTTVGFELEILGPDNVIIVPKEAEIRIDGRPILAPEAVTQGQMIQAGADHFSIGPRPRFVDLATREQQRIQVRRVTDPVLGPALPLWWLWLALILLGLVLTALVAKAWIVLSLAALLVAGGTWWLQRKRDNKELQNRQAEVNRATEQLTNDILTVRDLIARQCRVAHPSSASLTSGMGAEIPALQGFSATEVPVRTGRIRVALGLGDVTWEPPVDPKDNAGWDYQATVARYASLSAVPYLLDLNAGPIAIVGPLPATAAIARYLTKAAAAISDQEFNIISLHGPNNRVPDQTTTTSLVPSDHAIIQCPSVDVVPKACSTVVTVDAAGYATVMAANGDVLATDLVPHGLPEEGQRVPSRLITLDDQQSPEGNQGATPIQSLATADVTRFPGVHLYTCDSKMESKELLAGIGLELAERREPEQLSLTILDSGDRGLIRLWQLPHCVTYTTIDNDNGIKIALENLQTALGDQPDAMHVMLASEFPHLIEFLNRSGRDELAQQLQDLASQTDQVQLALVASETTHSPSDGPSVASSRDISRSVHHLQKAAQER